ncbi:MAG TPA: sulfite exporter TauE/SafE family protein [Gaiellaceae bacterium]|nr:sulfite exporter TauE/SafE family protein [Gaiellaceae bacterium]
MSATTIALAVLLGFAAGVLAGLFGVGGGILFVPTLVGLGLGQLEAQATSLLAILPTVAAGVLNQRRYGHFRPRAALVVGIASIAGVEAGARIATALPEDVLRRLFGVLLFVVAAQLVWRARRAGRPRYPETP